MHIYIIFDVLKTEGGVGGSVPRIAGSAAAFKASVFTFAVGRLQVRCKYYSLGFVSL